jgi:iron complex transport system substrate-binding protein
MIHSALRSAALLLMAAATVSTAPPSAFADVTVTDASGAKITVSDTSRIVSIGGDVTEILYALDADKDIIAVDSTSQFPAEALKKKTDVGYMRALSAEGVLATNPSVIIAAKNAGPPEVVALLRSSSVPYVEVPDDHTPEGVAGKIRFVASVVGADAAGDALAKQVEHDFAVLAKDRAKIKKPVRALFVLTVMNGRATVAGRDTSADAILKMAGAENAADMLRGFKPLADESAMEVAPDAIVTMRHSSSAFRSDHILSVKGLATSPAAENKRIVEMDGLYLLGFGPRAAQAARDLMKSLYPRLAQTDTGAGE